MISYFPPPSIIIDVAISLFAGAFTNEDEVAVFDSSYNQAFPEARPVKVTAMPNSRLMDHPVEDGSIITDFRIIMPTSVEVSLLCAGENYKDVFQQIKEAYLEGDVFTIIDKADTYFNMMIASLPYDLSSDMMDVIPVGLKFREVLKVETQYQPLPEQKVANKNDQSTTNTGNTTPKEEPKQSSAAASLLPNAFK